MLFRVWSSRNKLADGVLIEERGGGEVKGSAMMERRGQRYVEGRGGGGIGPLG